MVTKVDTNMLVTINQYPRNRNTPVCFGLHPPYFIGIIIFAVISFAVSLNNFITICLQFRAIFNSSSITIQILKCLKKRSKNKKCNYGPQRGICSTDRSAN